MTDAAGNLNLHIDLGKKAEETVSNLVDSLLAPAFRSTGKLLGNQIDYWRWRNETRLGETVLEKMKESKTTARIVPPSFLVPLLDAAATVDDEMLQDMWAELLHTAIKSETEARRAFVESLKVFSRTDAETLLKIHKSGGRIGVASVEKTDERMSITLLQAQGLIIPVMEVKTRDAGINRVAFRAEVTFISLTPYGVQFLAAVAPQLPSAGGIPDNSDVENVHHFIARFE